jgi:hypothetical protein
MFQQTYKLFCWTVQIRPGQHVTLPNDFKVSGVSAPPASFDHTGLITGGGEASPTTLRALDLFCTLHVILATFRRAK